MVRRLQPEGSHPPGGALCTESSASLGTFLTRSLQNPRLSEARAPPTGSLAAPQGVQGSRAEGALRVHEAPPT